VSSISQKSLLQAGTWTDATPLKKKTEELKSKTLCFSQVDFLAAGQNNIVRFKTLAQNLAVYSIKRC